MRHVVMITLLVGTLAMLGCKETSSRKGGIGQTCLSTDNCGGDLVCVSEVCQFENLPLDPSANVCSQCTTDDDCTSEGPQVCDDGICRLGCTADQDCVLFSPGGENACEVSTGECYFYGCDTSAVFPLACPLALVCDDSVGAPADPVEDTRGACFECLETSDCGEEQVCIDRDCEPTCSSDQDCDGFFACNVTTQRCEEVGCRSDRECAIRSSSYENQIAVCNEDADPLPRCELPCQRDADCLYFASEGASSSNVYCLDGACTDLGCETDDECRAFSGPNSVCTPPSGSSGE